MSLRHVQNQSEIARKSFIQINNLPDPLNITTTSVKLFFKMFGKENDPPTYTTILKAVDEKVMKGWFEAAYGRPLTPEEKTTLWLVFPEAKEEFFNELIKERELKAEMMKTMLYGGGGGPGPGRGKM